MSIKQSKKIFTVLTCLLAAITLLSSRAAYALEIVIEENGEGAVSEANVQSETTTEISQGNDIKVVNDIQIEADTGGNTANGNTGEVNIETGDVAIDTNITNMANNSVVANDQCCETVEETYIVSTNGPDSQNAIKTNTSNNVAININQNADVNNSINGKTNTGDNNANDNLGSVSIKTGNIGIGGSIQNAPLNTSHVSAGVGGGNLRAVISENAVNSVNLIGFSQADNIFINEFHTANIANDVIWNLNTGGNRANNNNGDVEIETGDIELDFFITNLANIGGVNVNCCEEPSDPGGPEDPGVGGTSEDPDSPSNKNASSSSTSDTGAVVGGIQILGLSDTSSPAAQKTIFWAGMLMMYFGFKIVLGEDIAKPDSQK